MIAKFKATFLKGFHKAAGFCFIPIFTFYWVFVATVGLVDDIGTDVSR